MVHIPERFIGLICGPNPSCLILLTEKTITMLTLRRRRALAKINVNLKVEIFLTQANIVRIKMTMKPKVQMFVTSTPYVYSNANFI